MSLKQKTVHSIFWSAIQQFGRQGISFIFSILLARILLPKEFGYIAMVMVFINICTTLIDSGLTQSLIRKNEDDEKDYSTIFFFNLGVSIFLYTLLYFIAPYIAGFYNQPILHKLVRWQAIILIIHALSLIQETLMVKNLEFKKLTYAKLPAIIISGAIALYLAKRGFGLYSIVAYTILDSGIIAIILWVISPWKPKPSFHIENFKKHYKFGGHLTISGILESGFNELYNIILGKFFSPAHLGFFNRAYTIQRLPVSNLSNVLNKVTYPILAKIKHNNKKLKEVYSKLMLMVVFIITPILIFSGILGKPLISLILTDKWLPAVPYFKILCLAGIIYPLNMYNINILKIKGKSSTILRLQLYKKIVFILSLCLIILYGMYGLLYGILINALLSFLLNSYFSGKLISFDTWDQLKNITPLIIINFISGTLVYLFEKETAHCLSNFMQLFIGYSIGFFIYITMVYLFEKRILAIIKEINASR